uniref:J domain-containing protein n=1 Tax=Oryza punctata TaxID=4537 RepID=A0A0E0L670_ORYPU
MDMPRRERRHHHNRKAAAQVPVAAPAVGVGGNGVATAAAARAAYGDVFGGPPRFAAPFGGAPADYAEVFGGVAATCSIPFLDLPPVAAVGADYGFFGHAGAGDYGEIFGRFDFGDFALPYEELFGDTEAEAVGEIGAEEIASSSGSSSRSSMIKESSQPDVQSFMLPQHFKEYESSVISFPPDNQQFVMSYNKTTQRSDDLVEMTTDPSMDYVVDSCEFSHVPATNHVATMDNGIEANGEKRKKSATSSASVSLRSSESDFTVDQKQHIPAYPPISEKVSANENHKNTNSISTPSNGTPSPDYAFLRVSDVNVQTQTVKPPPPLKQTSKLLKKREIAAKGDVHLENHSCTPASSAHAPSNTSTSQAERRDDTALFNTEANSSSAAAAMKEAMEYAEARLRAAKELMERKGDSFKLRKKPSHHRSTRSTEIKVPTESDTFDENLSVKKSKEEMNSEDSLLDKHQKASAVRIDHCDDSGKRALSLEKPQHIMQSCTARNQTPSKLGKLGNWTSGDQFYELTGEDQKQKTDTPVGEEDKCEVTNPVTKLSKEQKCKVTAADSDLERYEKLWEVNDGRDAGVKHVNPREDNTSPMGKDRVSTILEASTENIDRDKIYNSHFEGPVVVDTSNENHDGEDGAVEIPCKSGITISEPNLMKDMRSSFMESSSPVEYVADFGKGTTEESPVAGISLEPKTTKEELEAACDAEMQCTTGDSEKLQESSEVTNIDNSRARQIRSLILEDLEGSYESQAFPGDPGTAGSEAETYGRNLGTTGLETESYGREKFSFVEESFMHNANSNVAESPIETPIPEQVENVETEDRVGSCAHSEEPIMDKDAECPEEGSDITSQNNNLPDHEDSTMLNVFEVASKLIKRDLDQEKQDTLQPGELKTRTVGPDGFVLDSNDKDTKQNPSENSNKIGSEEVSSHGNQEDQKVPEMDKTKGQSDANAQGKLGGVNCYEDEDVMSAANNVTTRLTANSKDQASSSSEMRTGGQHLPQDVGPALSQTSNRSFTGLEKTEEVCKEAGRELPTDKSAAFEDLNSRACRVEEKIYMEGISKAEPKQQQSHTEKSSSLPKSAEGHISSSADIARKETPGVQRPKEQGSLRTEREREKDKEASRRLEETKETDKKFEKEREIAEERERKKLEEQEREREREKDRLAVERATREAHERAFAEARERAEKIALERVTAARQRASAEAREKEERASTEAAAERVARIKAERAAVERATAEARERAIEKAKAEKAAAEARERRERYRSSFKESFKSTNLDNRQDTQFQRAASSNLMRNPDSYSKGLEVESALRHKARLERHQRTAERVTKALAEKNMRDLLAQREQAEKHRLSEYLDPEIKRWSNGKEGNLRALLSTLQYILGADSGWQPVPLTELITAAAVKKAYRKATLCVHPDKLQQRGATIRQKYICEKVFDLLKDAWNKFTSEER